MEATNDTYIWSDRYFFLEAGHENGIAKFGESMITIVTIYCIIKIYHWLCKGYYVC